MIAKNTNQEIHIKMMYHIVTFIKNVFQYQTANVNNVKQQLLLHKPKQFARDERLKRRPSTLNTASWNGPAPFQGGCGELRHQGPLGPSAKENSVRATWSTRDLLEQDVREAYKWAGEKCQALST